MEKIIFPLCLLCFVDEQVAMFFSDEDRLEGIECTNIQAELEPLF